MNEADSGPAGGRGRGRGLAWAAGLLAVGALGGGLLAFSLPAGAQSPATSANAAATAEPSGQPHERNGQRPGETLLTGTDADKAQAAALAAVPGATVDRVETDADGAVYEAHITKSDGSKATVKFDKDFKVTAIEEGMGKVAGQAPPSR